MCKNFYLCTNDCDLIYDALCLDFNCEALRCTYIRDCKQTCDDQLIENIDNYNEIDIYNFINDRMDLRSKKRRKHSNKKHVRQYKNTKLSMDKGSGVNDVEASGYPSSKRTIYNNNNNNGNGYSYSYVDANGGITNNNNFGNTFDYDTYEVINNNNDVGLTDINRPAIVSYGVTGNNDNFGNYVNNVNYGTKGNYHSNVKLNYGNNNPQRRPLVTTITNNNNYNGFKSNSRNNYNNRYISGNTKLNNRYNQMGNGRHIVTVTNNNNGQGRVKIITTNNNNMGNAIPGNNNFRVMNNGGSFITNNNNFKMLSNNRGSKGHISTITVNNNNNRGNGRFVTKTVNNGPGIYINNDNNVPAGYSVINNNDVNVRKPPKINHVRKSKGKRKSKNKKHRLSKNVNDYDVNIGMNNQDLNSKSEQKNSRQDDDKYTINDNSKNVHELSTKNSDANVKVRRSLTENVNNNINSNNNNNNDKNNKSLQQVLQQNSVKVDMKNINIESNLNSKDDTKITNSNNALPQKALKESNNLQNNNNFGASKAKRRFKNRSFHINNNDKMHNHKEGKRRSNNKSDSNVNNNNNKVLSHLLPISDNGVLKNNYNLNPIRIRRCSRKRANSDCHYDDTYEDYNNDKIKPSVRSFKRIGDVSKMVQNMKNNDVGKFISKLAVLYKG